MAKFRTPGDIGAVDFVRPEVKDGGALADAWNKTIDKYIVGFDSDGEHVPGAVDLSRNYFDPRVTIPVEPPARVPWNGFPRAIDRFHQVLAAPTPAKLAQAEATADVLVETFFWWEVGDDGLAHVHAIDAQALSVVNATSAGLARRLRLGGGTGTEITISNRQQDEYVEWHADHDATGRLVRLSFTCEPPEYWDTLAKMEPDVVLAIYRELVGKQVERDDLFFPQDVFVYGSDKVGKRQWLKIYDAKTYNRFNKWNTSNGAVHLTHPANTLGAEVNLAARAANVYSTDGNPPDPTFDQDPALTRIACAGYGGINRSSDPNIGEQVGLHVAAGNRVSLTDPIGLYVSGIDLGSLQRKKADGTWVPVRPAEVLTIVRGEDASKNGTELPRILHFKLSGPEDGSWTLADCRFEQRSLERGGQIARKISMVIYANASAGGVDATKEPCEGTRYCRHPDAKGFFGAFDANSGIACQDLKAKDWVGQIPYTGVGTHFLMKISLTAKAQIETSQAPVGKGQVAAPPLATKRGRF